MSLVSLLFLVVVSTSLWVLIDAIALKVEKGKLGGGFFDMGAVGWFLSCLLLWIVGFPAYLAKRGEYKRLKEGKPTTTALSDLKALADLRDRGVLSADEFEVKKAQLLKRI